jgi:replicative DNA helicase
MTLQIENQRTSPKVPPHNVEAEESVLGAALLSSDAAGTALEHLHADDFYKPVHQLIFEAISVLFDTSQPIDAITVSDQLQRVDQLERIGGADYLTTLLDAVPTTSNIGYYVEIVEEHALRRRLQRAGGKVTDFAFETDSPIADVLDQAEQVVFQVAERRMGEGLTPIDPLLGATLERAEEMSDRGSGITGVATGFKDLDSKLAGLQPANLVVIAARPSMGKTTLALNISANIAARDLPVAIFSLEMSREEVAQRLLCAQARVDSQKLRTGELNQSQWTKLTHAAATLYNKPIFIDDSASLTVTEIRAKSRRLQRQRGLDLVVVDYLQLMHGGNARTENRQQEIAEISRNLKNLARELHVPIIAASQLNRALESREDKRPRLGDLRESGAIEQDSDVVMFIYRHEYYHPEAQEALGVAEVNIAKHRSGATGRVDMTFLPEFTLFSDMGRDVAA